MWTASGDPVYTVLRVWNRCRLWEFHDDKTFTLSHIWCRLARSTFLSTLWLHKEPYQRGSIASTIPCEDWKFICSIKSGKLINFSAYSLFTAFQLSSWPSLWYSMVCVQFCFRTHLAWWIIAHEALIINILYKNWRAFRQVKTKNAVSLSVLLRFIGFSIYRAVVAMYVSIYTLPFQLDVEILSSQ